MIPNLSSIWSFEPLWERLEYIAELVVLIGCVGEFLIDHEHILRGEDNKFRRHRLNRLFALILIGGLAVELGALARTNQLFDGTIMLLTTQARDARPGKILPDIFVGVLANPAGRSSSAGALMQSVASGAMINQ